MLQTKKWYSDSDWVQVKRTMRKVKDLKFESSFKDSNQVKIRFKNAADDKYLNCFAKSRFISETLL